MFYSIVGRNLSAGLVTADGVIICTTENFQWTLGQPIGRVLDWAAQHGIRWSASPVIPWELFPSVS